MLSLATLPNSQLPHPVIPPHLPSPTSTSPPPYTLGCHILQNHENPEKKLTFWGVSGLLRIFMNYFRIFNLFFRFFRMLQWYPCPSSICNAPDYVSNSPHPFCVVQKNLLALLLLCVFYLCWLLNKRVFYYYIISYN